MSKDILQVPLIEPEEFPVINTVLDTLESESNILKSMGY